MDPVEYYSVGDRVTIKSHEELLNTQYCSEYERSFVEMPHASFTSEMHLVCGLDCIINSLYHAEADDLRGCRINVQRLSLEPVSPIDESRRRILNRYAYTNLMVKYTEDPEPDKDYIPVSTEELLSVLG